MAQTVVTNFYSTRKRFKDPVKSLTNGKYEKLSETFVKDQVDQIVEAPVVKVVRKTRGQKVNKVTDYPKLQPASCKTEKDTDLEQQKLSEAGTSFFCCSIKGKAGKKTKGKSVNKVTNYLKSESSDNKESESIKLQASSDTYPVVVVTDAPPKTKSGKTRSKKVNKVTNYLKPVAETKKSENEVLEYKNSEVLKNPENIVSKEDASQKSQSEMPQTPKRNLSKDKAFQEKTVEVPRTPKRNLSSPEELTPSKKKALQELSSVSPYKLKECLTPKRVDYSPYRTLHLNTPNRIVSPRKITSPIKSHVSPQKAATYENMSNKDLASLVQESRNKILFSGKLDDLKKSLFKFSKASSKTKEFQANSCKITSVISCVKDSEKETKSLFQGEPAYKKYSYLAVPESHSLILPLKYKLLGETFRCMDAVVSMLNNRKENITFEKIQSGVQKMMKKNFLKSHLGQIMTVLPEAYSLVYEKNVSYAINKHLSPYQLVINPKLSDLNGNSTSSEPSTSKQKKNGQSLFIPITPQMLLERQKIFNHNLIKMAIKHHTAFLKKLNFPAVDDNSLVRWHPNFNVDGVPEIPVAVLPEEPETKVSTAKDVLNKIKGSVRGRVEKALQSVANEHKNESKEKSSSSIESKNNSTNRKQSSALKGICTDLLEKIRARESQKLIENMTRSVQDEKRSAMLERLPKIVHILWHYFIAERKAAVPVETAVDKIIHSFNSLTTPEEVKEHLQLISETMPGWLTFIKLPKGEFITMDKKKDINEMISNIG